MMKVWIVSLLIIALGSSSILSGDDDRAGRKILLTYNVHSRQVKRDVSGDMFGDTLGSALGFLSGEFFQDDFAEPAADKSTALGETTSDLSTESSEDSSRAEEDDNDQDYSNNEDFQSEEEEEQGRREVTVIEKFSTINNFYILIQPPPSLPSLEELVAYIQSNFPEMQSALGLQEIQRLGNVDSDSGSEESGGSGEESGEESWKGSHPSRIQYGCGRLSNDVIRAEEFKPIDIKDINVVKLSQVLKADVDAGLDIFQLVDHVLQIIEEDTEEGGNSGGGNVSSGPQQPKLAPEILIPIIPPPPSENNPPKIIFQDDNLIEGPGIHQLNRQYFEREESKAGAVEKLQEGNTIIDPSSNGEERSDDSDLKAEEASKEYKNFVTVAEILDKDSKAEVKAFMVGTILSMGFGVSLIALWKLIKAKRRELSSGKDQKCSFA